LYSKIIIIINIKHGKNRTGYLIVSYLVKKLKMKLMDAIDLFHQSRGEIMDKKFLIRDLFENLDNLENFNKFLDKNNLLNVIDDYKDDSNNDDDKDDKDDDDKDDSNNEDDEDEDDEDDEK
jgi:hypothetical protein